MPSATAIPVMDTDYPLNANAEQPIHVFANITSDISIDEVLLSYENPANGNLFNEFMVLKSGNTTNGTWTFEIPAQIYKGTIEFSIIAKDISGTSIRFPPSGLRTINLEGPEQERPFSWNIVVLAAFLAVALIATELIFKPGFYRPTGRQRARDLELEDQKRELEENEIHGK